jgi:rhodanese-related sulfurtransferase
MGTQSALVQQGYDYSPSQLRELCHLPDARNVPLDQLVERLASDRDRRLVVYCLTGLRSQRATRLLKRAGHEHVHNLGAMDRFGRS